MVKPLGTLPVSLSFALVLMGFSLLAHASLAARSAAQPYARQPVITAAATAQCGPDPVADAPLPPPTPAEALNRGVLIVVSIPSQKLFVFKDGTEWGSTTISTGRAGHGTPAGTFSILQKQVHHRSSTYYGAPMPYMQRLTWGGVALHAGHVTGRPASHGCIRLPWDFARRLYALTNPAATAVLIIKQPLQYADEARSVAGGALWQAALVQQAALQQSGGQQTGVQPYAQEASAAPNRVSLAPVGPPPTGRLQTIQLAAAANPRGADFLWQRLSESQPELQALSPVIIPATVRSVQVYRLRASGVEAHAICGRLMARGVACIKVLS
ncbi:MAG: L,D-transpeptidase family protein [Novosphingobium sp.]